MIRTLMIVFAFVTIAISLSACQNTFRGAGQDIERAGQEIQRSTR